MCEQINKFFLWSLIVFFKSNILHSLEFCTRVSILCPDKCCLIGNISQCCLTCNAAKINLGDCMTETQFRNLIIAQEIIGIFIIFIVVFSLFVICAEFIYFDRCHIRTRTHERLFGKPSKPFIIEISKYSIGNEIGSATSHASIESDQLQVVDLNVENLKRLQEDIQNVISSNKHYF